MTTHILATHFPGRDSTPVLGTQSDAIRWLAPAGRALFAAIFVMSAFGHFSQATIGYAASQGVPAAGVLVPLSGLLSLVGGLSVLLGYRARIGAGMLVLFLVPVTLTMHAFWAASDPTMAQMQLINFMKNVSLVGGALLLMYFGPGALSLDARRR